MATDTGEAIAEAAAGAAEAGAESVGMPQLDFASFPNQIFWLVVTLVVIYLILNKVALPRIGGILAERAGTITNDIAEAENLKARAQEAEAAYEQALADARAEALRIAAETKAEIKADLNDAIARADAEIAARSAESEAAIAEIRASALDSIRLVAADTAAALVSVLGGKAKSDVIESAVDQRLKG